MWESEVERRTVDMIRREMLRILPNQASHQLQRKERSHHIKEKRYKYQNRRKGNDFNHPVH